MNAKPTQALSIKTSKIRWEHADAIAHAITELNALGYAELAPVQTKLLGFVKMLALANVRQNAYAILHDEAQSIWVDFFSVQTKAPSECFAATNAQAPLIGLVAQRPTFFISHQLPKVSIPVLHEEFMRHRPKRSWARPGLKKLPAAYQQVCAADSRWQEQHLQGKKAEKAMQEVVAAAYARAQAAQRRIPAEELLLLLRDLKAEERAKLPETLTAAATKGNLEAMKLFLEGGADINEETGYVSPLAAAAQFGQLGAVNFLLDRGADLKPGGFAFSAIVKAARRGYYEIVERLLAAGVPREQRKAALNAAAQEKHAAVVSLLKGRPVPNALRPPSAETTKKPSLKKAMDEMTSLMGREPDSQPLNATESEAAEQRALELFRSKEVRAAVNTDHKPHGSIYGHHGTYLELAVETGRTPLVNAALAAGSSPEVVSSALITAAGRGALDHVDLLLKAGADAKHDAKHDAGPGWTALLAAARWGDPKLVRRLLDAGANPRTRTEGGETPMTAVCGPFSSQIRAMLKEAAQPKAAAKGSAITTRGKPRKDFTTARGAAHFKKAIGHPEWSLACIEAAPDEVARAFAKQRAKARWHADTAQARISAKPPFVLIFRLRGHAWTILLRTIGWLEMEDLKELPEDARLLSAALKTRALTYMSEDTSGCEGYELFDKGKSIERADWMGDVKFKSTWRKKPKFGNDFPEPTFTELGIYLPECWMDHDGYETKLVLGGIPTDAVERLDCFELKPTK